MGMNVFHWQMLWNAWADLQRESSITHQGRSARRQCPEKMKTFRGGEEGWTGARCLTWSVWLVQDENGGASWGAQRNRQPSLMVAARVCVRLFTQTCMLGSATCSAAPGPALMLPETWGLHAPHWGAQPWAPAAWICSACWAHRWHSPFPGTGLLGCLCCVHQISKVRHGPYLSDCCWQIVSSTVHQPTRLFGGHQVVHAFAEKHPKRSRKK